MAIVEDLASTLPGTLTTAVGAPAAARGAPASGRATPASGRAQPGGQVTQVDGHPPAGTPWQLAIAEDGSRVAFLRTDQPDRPARLWVYDVARDSERPVTTPATGAVTGYAIDAAARTAVFPVDGQLHRADLTTGELVTLPTSGPAAQPRVSPDGRWVGYLTGGALRVRPAGGGTLRGDALLAGELELVRNGRPQVSWGCGGWWWAPDSGSVLAVRTDTGPPARRVSLHLLELDGGWVDVHWDRETYPHLANVCWSDHGNPVVAVLRRAQQHGLVLAIDPRTGETQVHAELADPRWVDPVPGTPRHLPDGRVLVGGELAHDGYDARCLFADGALLTPPALYVRRVVGRIGPHELLVEATAHEPSEQHLYRVDTSVGAAGVEARPVTSAPGWHRAEVGGDTIAVGTESLDHPGVRWSIWRAGAQVGELTATAAPARPAPRPLLQRVTDRRLPAGVLYPDGHVSGRRLPVLVEVTGALRQRVRLARSAWLGAREWAESGYAVVVVDPRGTPGVAPSFEKVVHRRLADLALADLVDALAGLVGKHPDLDLTRVAIRGHGVGGWLAALAALRRPDAFRCAVAHAPLVDWSGADAALAERYLGAPDDSAEVYQRHSLLAGAAEADLAAPLLLVPDTATAAGVDRLAGALRDGGHPYTVLAHSEHSEHPEHPDPGGRAERDFLRRHTRPHTRPHTRQHATR